MISPAFDAAEKVDLLAASLDGQIRLLEAKIAQLDDLSQGLVACDNDRMERVLAAMESLSAEQSRHGRALAAARRELAEALGCESGRLADLIMRLPGPWRQAIQSRRALVGQKVKELRNKHMTVATLLSECSRVNRLMLECLFPSAPAVTVYAPQGADHWRGSGRLLDMER